MTTNSIAIDLDERAAETVRLGREVADMALRLHLGGTAMDAALVSRCLARMAQRQPFGDTEDGGLAAVLEILENDLASEAVGTESQYVETQFGDFGQEGEMQDVPVYSDRGTRILELRGLFHHFMRSRASVLDHIAAHRALNKMMSG